MNTKKYYLKNLGCANCASKMETKINALPEIADATITFATKQLVVTAENPDTLLQKIQKICSAIEHEVQVIDAALAGSTPNEQHSHSHEHTHSHEHEHTKKNHELLFLVLGSILFAGGVAAHLLLPEDNSMPWPLIILFVIAYLLLGKDVLLSAGKNILKGQLFNENFLMSIATLGAFAIGDYPEAVGVMLFFNIGELFEHRAVEKSRRAIMDAVDMRPETITLIQNDITKIVPAAEAKIGDLIQVRPGDRIPLDGIVTDGESRIDTSPVTGEPVPVKCSPGDSLLSGCINTSGLLTLRVEKELKDSMVTKILDAVENAAAGKPKLDRFISRFARIYTPIVVFSALAVAVIPSLVTGDWNHWIYTALTFLVISCPCALVLSVPLAFFTGIGAGSKKGILFKGGSSLEALNHIGAVVMDKTGTITKGNFEVQKLDAKGIDENELLSFAASAEQSSTHPIGESIKRAALAKKLEIYPVEELKELAGLGIEATIQGKHILCGKRELLEQKNITPAEPENVYGTLVYCAIDGVSVGCIILSDTIKPDAAEAIARLKKKNLHTLMLTGDNEASASYVSRQVGIDETAAGLYPADKLSKCKSTRAEYGAVLFVGDGINDAPVLAGADVGAAMGSGADAAINAADVVFMTSEMNAIPDALTIAKRSISIAKQNIAFALFIKALVMVFGLMGIANMWLAVFADSGVAMLCVLNSIRTLRNRT